MRRRPDCPKCSSGNVNFDSLHERGRRTYHCNTCANTWDELPVGRVKMHLKNMDTHMGHHVRVGQLINPRTLWHQMNPLMDGIQADSGCDMPWGLLHLNKKLYSGRTPLRPRQVMRWWLMATTDLRRKGN